MTKNAAIHSFFSSFGLPAFPSASVPTSDEEKPSFPYLTYSVPTSSDMDVVQCDVSLWYRTENWTGINAKTEEISQIVGKAYLIECDGGGIIVRKGTPFAQPMGDDTDNMIKRKILTFELTFVTMN